MSDAETRYPAELRERVVRMVLDHEHEYGSQWEAITSVAEKLAPNPEAVRVWVGRAELRRANEILRAASAFFGAELDDQSRM